MGLASFTKGVRLLIESLPHVLTRKVDRNLWQVEEEKTGRIKEFHIHDLHKLYAGGALVFADDSTLSPMASDYLKKKRQEFVFRLEAAGKNLEEEKRMRQYVLAVKDLPVSEKIMKPIIRQVWERLGSKKKIPHWTSVARWKRRYIASGNDIFGLMPKHFDKGNRTSRYPKEVIEFVEDAIDLIYMKRERQTMEDTLSHAIVMVERENELRPANIQLPLPTKRLVKSRIDLISAFDRYAARYGHMAAIRKYRSVLYMNVAIRPLECAEMDHTRADLFVIDDKTGIPWGRPWLTICIDSNTRCILGIYIGFEPPSYLTVARCLKHCFLPKVDLQETYPDIKNSWDPHGVMEKLIVDNGEEFHSHSLDAACFSMGIDLQYTPRKTPWWKGKIERFNGTINRETAHGNPGTTFANIFEKDDYNPAEHAIVTLGTLKTIVHKWIVDVYHQRPHRSLDKVPPAIKWASSIAIEDIQLPEDPAHLDVIMGKVEKRVLSNKAIQYEGLLYNSPELIELRRKLGSTFDVELRVDEGDLGYVHVIAPDQSAVIRVPCIQFEYANGITSWQHKLFKRYAAQHLNLGSNPNAWRHAKVAISEIVQREVFKKSSKKKNKTGNYSLARYQNASPITRTTATSPVNASPAAVVVPSTHTAPSFSHETTSRTTSAPSSLPRVRPNFEPIIEDRSGT